MTRLVRDYVRFTGDVGFLDERADDGRTVLDHLRFWARAWQGLRRSSPLADYGEIENLLECVSSYTHEVASFNAANVWNLRDDGGRARHARRRRRRGRAARRGGRARRRGAQALHARRGLLRGAPARRVEAAGAALLRLQHRRHHDLGRPRRDHPRRDGGVLPARAADARVAARALAVGSGCLVQRAARPPVERRLHRLARRFGPRAHRARRAAGRPRLAARPRPHGEPGPARAGALRRRGAAAASTAGRARRRRSCRTSTTGRARRRARTSPS